MKCRELEQPHQSLSKLNEMLEIPTWRQSTLLPFLDAAVSSSGKQNINMFM
jgi:hypothetical protein